MEYQAILDLEDVQKIRVVCDDYSITYGVNPLTIYCAHTGRELGALNDDAIRLLMKRTDLDAFDPADLVEHCMLAARPSPTWSYQTVANFRTLLLADPTGAACYYIMRAFESTVARQKAKCRHKASGRFEHAWKHRQDKAQWQHARVVLFRSLQDEDEKILQRVTAIMLKADAQIGLHNITPPESLGFPEITDWEALIKYYLRAVEHHARRLIHRKREGTTLSSMIWHGYQRTTEPPTKSAQLKMARQEKRNTVASAFVDLLGGHVSLADASNIHESGNAFKEKMQPIKPREISRTHARVRGALTLD